MTEMTFTDSYISHKQNYAKCPKKEALIHVENLIEGMKNNDIDPIYFGEALSRLETYFAPALIPKKDPLDWCIQALIGTDCRAYAKYGLIIEDIGLCCTDSHRLHILKNFKGDTSIIDTKKQWLTLEDIEYPDFSWYPNVECILSPEKLTPGELEIIDNDNVMVGGAIIDRKYFNQAISGMKNYTLSFINETTPVYIEDENKLAIIMPKTPVYIEDENKLAII
jgi:hypothetical protein